MSIFIIRRQVKKLIASAAGALNWAGMVRAGVALAISLRALVRQSLGAALVPIYFLVSRSIAGASLLGMYAGVITPTQAAGIIHAVYAHLGYAKQVTAARIVQITYGLVGTYGAATATSAAATGAQWAAPTNAQGVKNTTMATLTQGGLLAAANNSTLTMAYAALAGKSGVLTLESAKIRFWVRQTLGLLQACSCDFSVSTNGGSNYAQVYVNAAAFDFTVTPFEYVFPAGVTWADLNALRTKIHATQAAAASSGVVSIDAVELIVTATTTQVP